jgi:hypothetical protein
MGNGLYGLMRVVGLNGGRMEIRSGRGHLVFRGSRLFGDYKQSRPVLDPDGHRGTLVDWQLDVARPVSLTQALGVEQPNLRLEAIEGKHSRPAVRMIGVPVATLRVQGFGGVAGFFARASGQVRLAARRGSRGTG